MNIPRPIPYVALFALLFVSGTASASELAIVGIYSQAAPVAVGSSANAGFTAGNTFAGGIQFTASVYKSIELELGASYGLRSWSDTVSGALSMPAYDFPIGLRLRIFRAWALDAGGYYSSINAGSRVSYVSTQDYGAFGGTQLLIPLSGHTSLLLAGRYVYGLSNVSLVGGQLCFRGIEGLSGLALRF